MTKENSQNQLTVTNEHSDLVKGLYLLLVDAIKEYMKEHGIQQQDLAKRMNISKPTLSAMLNGGHTGDMRITTLERIIDALETDLTISIKHK